MIAADDQGPAVGEPSGRLEPSDAGSLVTDHAGSARPLGRGEVGGAQRPFGGDRGPRPTASVEERDQLTEWHPGERIALFRHFSRAMIFHQNFIGHIPTSKPH
ncbi:hypothetical protein [Actinoallomurus iriomotensis]|uniref:hypothetical protein n=1 Tax=Actinoallomurus iriomotensis TaxID=478107 RepID=UPI002555AB5F|nr:hypothetical protein [Actinoallomurus iriomotensis]